MPYDFSTWDRNCDKEQTTPIEGSGQGDLPPWLRGAFILNGPGIQKYGEQEFNHVFDGSAVLQKFNFTETGVTYMSKFLRSYAYLANTEHKQVVVSEFGTVGTSVAKGKLQKFGDKFNFERMFSDNAPVTVVKMMGKHYATTESPFIHELDLETLDTIHKFDLKNDLGINSQCPHPWELPDGTTINIMHTVGPTGPKYDIVQFPVVNPKEGACGKPAKIGSVDARWKLNPCHMHTFAVTESYVVLFEQPLTIDVKAMVANTVYDRPFIGGMEWMKNKMVKYHLVSRATGKRLKYRFKSEAFFYLHIANSYEDNGHVIVDVCVFDKADVLHALTLKNIRENPQGVGNDMGDGRIIRIVLPTVIPDKCSPDQNLVTLAGTSASAYHQKDGIILIKPEALTKFAYENPTINRNNQSKPYRYLYGASGEMEYDGGRIGKVDTQAKEVTSWSEANGFPTTCVFVPRPGAEAEDDGVLLVNSLLGGTASRNVSRLVVLNAADMKELASYNFTLPAHAPRALHSIFVS